MNQPLFQRPRQGAWAARTASSELQDLKNTLSDDEADLADEIHKRDIIANLHGQPREDADRLN